MNLTRTHDDEIAMISIVHKNQLKKVENWCSPFVVSMIQKE